MRSIINSMYVYGSDPFERMNDATLKLNYLFAHVQFDDVL